MFWFISVYNLFRGSVKKKKIEDKPIVNHFYGKLNPETNEKMYP